MENRDDDSLIISAIRNPTKAVQLAGESFRRNIKEIADKQFPLPFEPSQIDLANRKINWRPGQKEKLANDSVSFAAGNNPAMMLSALKHLPETEFSKAHALAQKNAALPVEQGGLGLHPDNTAMERARALGFDVDNPVYHGTNADFNEFNLDKSGSASGAEQYGSGVYTASSPSIASGYANTNMEGANVMPLLVNMKNPILDGTKGKLTKPQIKSILQSAPDLEDALWNFGDIGYEGKNRVFNTALNQVHEYQGDKLLENLHPIANDFYSGQPQAFNDAITKTLKKDGVKVDFDNGEKFLIPFNPKQVRSRFAAFDPLKKNSANILAGAALGSTLLEKDKKRKDK